MKRKSLSSLCMIFLLALCLALPAFGTAESQESFDASTMRLLKTTGDVQILDLEGVPRFVLENVRFASGETMVTGEDSLASVGLDDSKIVTLDALTRVGFIQEGEHMLLNLLEGQIFIDVSEKLDENATFDIQTTTLSVGIRGTLIFGRVVPGEKPGDPAVTTFGVLEGAGQVDAVDTSGTRRVFTLQPGEIVTAEETGDGGGASFAVREMTAADTQGFVQEVVNGSETLQQRVVDGSPNGQLLLAPPEESGTSGESVNLYPAGGAWSWTEPVQIVAQSASKLYDGEPLRRPDGALVSGLPETCSIDVTCSGAQTDAGTGTNHVDSYTVFNSAGDDITGHFTQIDLVDGTLRVDPAPLTVWTGSETKVYDGEPLTCEDGGIRTVSGYLSEEPVWRNTSVVSRTALGAETMVGVSGSVWVHGSNPLTGEEKEIELKTGQRLSVSLGSDDGGESISFTVEPLQVSDLPDDVLRLYAANPDLMAQACEDVPEWDPAELQALVSGMDLSAEDTVARNGLNVPQSSGSDVMTDSSNVRITMDSGITNYSTRILTESVAHFVPVTLDPSIRVIVTGIQEGIGESENTCDVDWGTANPDNYTVTEELGTLKIEPLDVEINCGGYNATYSGSAFLPWPTLTYRNGAHAGERISCSRVTGSVPGALVSDTRLRAASHTYHFILFTGDTLDLEISGFGTAPGVYNLTGSVTSSSPNLGSIGLSFSGSRLVIQPAELTVSTGSAVKEYDGEPLTCNDAAVTGLLGKDSVTVRATGRQTGIGVSANTYEIDWGSTNPECYTVVENLGTLTVKEPSATPTPEPAPIPLTISTEPKTAVYDGEPLAVSDEEIKVTGLVDGDKIDVYIENAEITDVGSVTPSFRIDWRSVDKKKYEVKEKPGKLTVTPNPAVITVTDQSATATYDGGAHEHTFDVTVEGLPDALTAKPYNCGQWWQDAGEYTHTSSILIVNNKNEDVTGYFTGIRYVPGTLTVNKRNVTLTSADASKKYNGAPLTSEIVTLSGDGFADGEGAVYSATGTITDAGSTPNTISYTLDSNTKEDNYNITLNEGTLTVEKRNVTLTSADASKKYDGTPLTDDTVTLSGDGFVPGEGATYNATGTITDAGNTPNTISYTLNSNTKESNYNITLDEGTLKVEKRNIKFISPDISKMYDGTLLLTRNENIFEEGDGPAPGEQLPPVTPNGQLDVGSSPNTIMLLNYNSTKISNYNITMEEGTLTVTPRPVTLTSGDASKVYDGTPLTNDTVTVGGSWFALGEGASYSTASLTTVGSIPNAITCTLNSNTKESNYNITKTEGTLTVTPANLSIAVHPFNPAVTFNGSTLNPSSVIGNNEAFVFDLPTGDRLTLTIQKQITSESAIVTGHPSIKNIDSGEDRSFCYTIDCPPAEVSLDP